MGYWENNGESSEWYTPQSIFTALGCRFDMDAAAPEDRKHCCVPADKFITSDSLNKAWEGFVWLNPPFGKRGSKMQWVNKMNLHQSGILLLPDRTSTDWWKCAAIGASAILFITGKVKFINNRGLSGDSPSVGTNLFAYGTTGVSALRTAQERRFGIILKK
jgi:DNA N-6-adenine-methyltransferase (Dam)